MSRSEVVRALGTSIEKVREAHRRGLIDRLPRVDELGSWDWASAPPRDCHDDDASHDGDECLADSDNGDEGLDPYRAADAVDPYRSLPSEEDGLE